jgi:hypothetical protein
MKKLHMRVSHFRACLHPEDVDKRRGVRGTQSSWEFRLGPFYGVLIFASLLRTDRRPVVC